MPAKRKPRQQVNAIVVVTSDSDTDDTPAVPVKKKAVTPRTRTARKTRAAAGRSDGAKNKVAPQPNPPVIPPNPAAVEAVNNPTEPSPDVCPVCIEPPVHPVALACKHVYCYLCAKGLTETENGGGSCSLCRQPILQGYLRQKAIVERTRSDLESCTQGVDNWQWFYEGRDGWWKFEKRCNEELEDCFKSKMMTTETMICGHLYVVDFENLVQYRKDLPLGRRRKIKRDVVFAHCKGVAGLVPKAN